MAERNHHGDAERIPAMTQKATTLEAQASVEDYELDMINELAMQPLAAEDVFTFKAVLCDNKLDRHYERFTVNALKELRALFMGKTVIKDHNHSADSQVARIYMTELVTHTKELLDNGEPYTQLVAHCYMLKTAANADLIADILGGIKKEGSVGFRTSGAICSICGTDNAKNYCRHWPGRNYEKEGGQALCTFTLTGASDAYEFSLVAVPAQRAAGVCKSYTGETVYAGEEPDGPDNVDNDDEKMKTLELRARLLQARAKANH